MPSTGNRIERRVPASNSLLNDLGEAFPNRLLQMQAIYQSDAQAKLFQEEGLSLSVNLLCTKKSQV